MKSMYLTLLTIVALAGCSQPSRRSPDVAKDIRDSLDHARFTDVSVSQDRDKGVVTLSGHVAADRDKAQAQAIAQTIAGGQVVANEIAVQPPGLEGDAKRVTADLDKGIEQNLDAALVQNGMQHEVKAKVTTGVVTLTGEVGSQRRRAEAEHVAASVPNVAQVVNELQVKDQKATSR
jgi:osmotically-inducible protein OsmY